MIRRTLLGACVALVVVLVCVESVPTAAPIKLARHPDYHAGTIAFSYLGDIWTASEDGRRPGASPITARARCTRASRPTASGSRSRRTATATTTSSSCPPAGGTPQRLTFHTGGDDVVGWTRDSTAGDVPRGARRRRVSRTSPRCSKCRSAADRSSRCRWTGATAGSYSPDGKSLVFNRHPSTWTRQHYRGSYAADLWVPTSPAKTYTPAAGRRALQPLLADVGRRQRDLLRRRSAARTTRDVKPGSPEVRKSANNIYKIPVERRPAGAGDASPRRQPVLAVDVERRQGDRLRGDVRHLEAGRRDRQDQRDHARHRQRRQGERGRTSRWSATRSTRSTSRRRAGAR